MITKCKSLVIVDYETVGYIYVKSCTLLTRLKFKRNCFNVCSKYIIYLLCGFNSSVWVIFHGFRLIFNISEPKIMILLLYPHVQLCDEANSKEYSKSCQKIFSTFNNFDL